MKPESKIRKELSARLEAMAEGGPDITFAVVSGYPGTAIPDFAEKCGADLIVVPSHRPGLQDYFLGSTASRVVQSAQCSVLVLRLVVPAGPSDGAIISVIGGRRGGMSPSLSC